MYCFDDWYCQLCVEHTLRLLYQVPRVAADAARDAAAIAQAHLELAGDRADHGVQANNTRATNEVAQHRIFSREKRWVATVPARNALEVEEQSRRHVHGMDRDRNVPLAKCSNHQLRLLHSKMRQRQLQLRQERALLHGQWSRGMRAFIRVFGQWRGLLAILLAVYATQLVTLVTATSMQGKVRKRLKTFFARS